MNIRINIHGSIKQLECGDCICIPKEGYSSRTVRAMAWRVSKATGRKFKVENLRKSEYMIVTRIA